MAYDLSPVDVQCPVCGRTEAEVLWKIDCEQLTQTGIFSDRDPARAEAIETHIASLWGQPHCQMVRCRTCTFEFADPFVAGVLQVA